MPRDGVACEHCGAQRICNNDQPLEMLREQLRTVGWLCQTVGGGIEIDVCPACRVRR